MATTDDKPKPASWQKGAETVTAVVRSLALLAVIIFIGWHWTYFSAWFNNTTHVELGSLKVDRYVQAQQQIEKYARSPDAQRSAFNPEYAQAAVALAARVSPALNGAMVLWVDPKIANNQPLVDILSSLGIAVVRVDSTAEALHRLNRENYALVISNVHRVGDEGGPLKTCPVHYFDFPDDQLRKQFHGDIAAFNQSNNTTSQAGFSLLERMRNGSSGREIPVVFFTAEAAGKIGTECPTLVTNRFDILLQQVVSTLALERWQTLTADARHADAKS